MNLKTITIVRHAKSSWDFAALDDFDRPLNNRGNQNAPIMAERLKKQGIKSEVFLSSPAKRAFSTAMFFAKALNFPEEQIQQNKNLYLASASQILNTILLSVKKTSSIVVFGHNPGVTAFINKNTTLHLDNLPTCGIATFHLQNWNELGTAKGEVVYFDYPKK